MACHLIIGSYKYAFVIAAYSLFAYGTVEEDYRNALSAGLVDNVLGRIVGAAVHKVYNQKRCSLCNSCGNLFCLCCLAVVTVVILICDSF